MGGRHQSQYHTLIVPAAIRVNCAVDAGVVWILLYGDSQLIPGNTFAVMVAQVNIAVGDVNYTINSGGICVHTDIRCKVMPGIDAGAVCSLAGINMT